MPRFLGMEWVTELLVYPPPPSFLGHYGLSRLHTHLLPLAGSHAPLCQQTVQSGKHILITPLLAPVAGHI